MLPEERRSVAADLEATLAARRELDPAYEPALVESFLDRIDEAVQQRVAAEVKDLRRREKAERPPSGSTLTLAMVSLGTGIPITAIGSEQGLAGIITVWVGIVGVNAVFALSRRPRRPRS